MMIMISKLIYGFRRRKRFINKSLVALVFSLIGLCFGICMTAVGSKDIKFNRKEHGSSQQIGKELVLVAVMTSAKFVHTRIPAIMDTWFPHIPGKVLFFSSEKTFITADIKHIPIIRLKGVTDTYPPQKKSFVMMKYLYDNYGDNFEWFMRVDDDMYIKGERLRIFLSSMDSRKPYFIGQTGTGLQSEKGKIGLGPNDNFCMGGPGMIISRGTLERFVPHIQDCLLDLRSHHEDVEVGRCIRRWANISCTWNYEMLHILYNHPKGTEGFRGNLQTTRVAKAINLHPIKNISLFYKVHYTLLFQELRYLQRVLQNLQGDLVQTSAFEEETKSTTLGDNHWEQVTKLSRFRCDDNCKWTYITAGSQYAAVDGQPVRSLPDEHKQVIEIILDHYNFQLNRDARKLGRFVDNVTMASGQVAITNNRGFIYILEVTYKHHKYVGKKSTRLVRKRIFAHIPLFSHWRLKTLNFNPGTLLPVNFIVPCYGRPLMLKKFLRSFENAFEFEKEGSVTLTVIASDHEHDIAQILKHAKTKMGNMFRD